MEVSPLSTGSSERCLLTMSDYGSVPPLSWVIRESLLNMSDYGSVPPLSWVIRVEHTYDPCSEMIWPILLSKQIKLIDLVWVFVGYSWREELWWLVVWLSARRPAPHPTSPPPYKDVGSASPTTWQTKCSPSKWVIQTGPQYYELRQTISVSSLNINIPHYPL